jgi:hypothetical protein
VRKLLEPCTIPTWKKNRNRYSELLLYLEGKQREEGRGKGEGEEGRGKRREEKKREANNDTLISSGTWCGINH